MSVTKVNGMDMSSDVTLSGTTPTLTIGDAGAEDAAIVFDGNAQDFHIGLDDTADDLVIGKGSALGTTTHMAFTEDGEVTKPLQPYVLVKPSGVQSDIAVGSPVTIVWGTETYDVGANFATNTFTAPVTGKYLINYLVRLENVDTAASNYYIGLVTSNETFNISIYDPGGLSADITHFHLNGSLVAHMDAADTFYTAITQSSGTAQTDIGSSSYLSISLLS